MFLLGNLPNKELPDCYCQADVFILPSLSEGMGVSLLEAMSSGCPVVATKVGGVPDVIKDGESGLLVKSRSSEKIAQAVIKILSDVKLRNHLIKEARQTVEKRYDWQIVADSFKLLYQKLCIPKKSKSL